MIDFVIPTYNRYEKTLRAVYSALYFCHKYGGRIIVLDNHSDDDSFRKLSSHFQNTSCVDVYLSSPSCQGKPSFNWLEGLRASSSSHVHLLFSDDFLLPSFEAIYAHINNSLEKPSSFLYCHIPSFYNECNRRLARSKYYSHMTIRNHRLNPLYFRYLILKNFFVPRSPCAFTFDRKVAIACLEKSHSFFSKYLEEAFQFGAGIDTLMIYYASFESIPILFARSSTISFTIHGNSITVSGNNYLSKFYDIISAKFSVEPMSYALRFACFYTFCAATLSSIVFLAKRNIRSLWDSF